MSALNNENDYRVPRTRTKLDVSAPVPLKPQEDVVVTQAVTSEISKTAQVPQKSLNPQSSQNASQSVISTADAGRGYLRDVSRKFGISKMDPSASKKRPLGGEIAPLAPSTGELQKSARLVKADVKSTSQSSVEVLAEIPLLRMPQKRQATESSTNLVEKLHVASEEESLSKFKKSRRDDYEWEDLDEEDMNDPLMVSEYVNEIFPYLHELEKKTLPDPTYLFKQTHLKPKMRLILVDWLVEMHQRFRLLPETLFLAINVMDRFMSVEVVQIDKLQLLATGALFIAAKYEEVFSPSVKNYAYFTEGSYTESEILVAEKYILKVLEFDLNYPNPMNFLRRISKADDYDVQLRTLGKYLLEISLVDHNFIGILPSLCSAAAMYVARLILKKSPVWDGNLIHYSGGYKVDDMRDCVGLLIRYLEAPIEHDEFHKKYAARKFMRASVICRNWAKKVVSEGRDVFDASLHTQKVLK